MKRFLCLLFLAFVLLSLTSCSHVEDTNGSDDYSIVTFLDEEIIHGSRLTSTFGTFKTNSHINDKLKGRYRVSKLSGVVEVNTYETNKQNIKFEFEFTCKSGNAMIAIVANNKIVKKISANQDVTFDIRNMGHEYKIVLVGESAKVRISYVVNSYN